MSILLVGMEEFRVSGKQLDICKFLHIHIFELKKKSHAIMNFAQTSEVKTMLYLQFLTVNWTLGWFFCMDCDVNNKLSLLYVNVGNMWCGTTAPK